MLSEIVKRKIEEQANLKVRYSKDCDILSEKIFGKCKCKPSGSTLRRLFGFVKGTKSVRLNTLDIIANYLDYSTWEDLIATLDSEKRVESKIIKELISSELKRGEMYLFKFKPNGEVVVKYMSKNKFKVVEASNSIFKAEDVFVVGIISLHRPIFISCLYREGEELGRKVEAMVSGITSIIKK